LFAPRFVIELLFSRDCAYNP